MNIESEANNVKVTIITVSYNCEDTIELTLESVLNQSYPNIEYIVVDGCSTDNTVEIIKKHPDSRIKLIVEPDDGIYDAMNKGFMLATGDLVHFLNSGDYFIDNKIIDKLVRIVAEDTTYDGLYGDIIKYGVKNQLIKLKRSAGIHMLAHGMCHQALFVKKSSYSNGTPFDTNFRIYADWAWLLDEIFNNNMKLKYIDEPVVYYKDGGISELDGKKHSHEEIQIINRHLNHVLKNKSMLVNYTSEYIFLSFKYTYLFLRCLWYYPILRKT
jgi:glycosyltransferase involved in cell wall biosynthesis